MQYLLNHCAAVFAHHGLKHLAILVGVGEHLIGKRECPVINTAPLRERLTLALPE
jgi:hypothetical protein